MNVTTVRIQCLKQAAAITAIQQVIFHMNILIPYVPKGRSLEKLAAFIHLLGQLRANRDYLFRLPCGGAQVATGKPTVNGNRLLPSQRAPITASLSSTTSIENIIRALACLNYFQVAKCFEA